jgi:SAM-dependent methyltransferase
VSGNESPLRLNLGSGNRPLAGFVNVDSRPLSTVDVVADVRSLPFSDNSAVEIEASSLLEHFADPYAVLDEIHRVLAPQGVLRVRVPSPWAQAGFLDSSHEFLADLKQWREILGGYFAEVRAKGEGVRYRDNALLVLLNHVAVSGLRMHELAQVWLLTCRGKRETATRAYVPWWLEDRAQA